MIFLDGSSSPHLFLSLHFSITSICTYIPKSATTKHIGYILPILPNIKLQSSKHDLTWVFGSGTTVRHSALCRCGCHNRKEQ